MMKGFCWLFWFVHAVCSTTWLALSVTTSNSIQKQSWDGMDGQGNTYKSGLLASCVLGFIAVFMYLILSPVVMLGKLCGANLKLTFGVLLGSGLSTAWLMLLVGLILNTQAGYLNDPAYFHNLSSSEKSAFQACFAFAYILVGTFLILTILLFFGRESLSASGSASAAKYQGPASSGGSELQMKSTGAPPAQWPPAGTTSTHNPSSWGGWNGGTNV